MMRLYKVLVLLMYSRCLYNLTSANSCNKLTDIHIIGFFPCTDPNDTRGIPVDNCDGIERIPIMKLALEEINERCDLLPGYRLVVDYANSACSSIPATYHLIQLTDPSQPTKLMILGPACSMASELMGGIAEKFLHIPQVAYTVSSSVFGKDKDHYPRFYRLIPITEQIVNGYFALVKKLKWRRVLIISYDSEFFLNVASYITQQWTSSRILAHVSFSEDPNLAFQIIKELNARIIFAWIPENVAAMFWCKVIKEKLAGPDFVWFLPSWFRPNWWAAVDGTDCNAEEMSRALEHSIVASGSSILDNDPSRVLVSNKNVSQFKKDLQIETAQGTVQTDVFLNVGYVYDAVWTIALALNSSISILEERELGRLEDFTYDSIEIADVFSEAIANLTFEGISGKVFFQKNGNRINPPDSLSQYRDGVTVPVLIYDPSSNESDGILELPGQTLMWKGGYVPSDKPSPELQQHSQAEIVIVIVTTSLGILSTVYFIIFNIYYRKNQVVKRSSYRLNTIILAAVLFGFIGTLLYIIRLDSCTSRTSSTALCNIRYWTPELAFVVCFATLFAKIWRLYKVFFNKQMVERKYLKDQYLLVLIVSLVTPTVIILIIQITAFPIMLYSYTQIDMDNLAQEKIFVTCEGKHYLIFDAVLFMGDIILALLSLVLAYKTKKHLPVDKKYRRYHESAVVNLTAMVGIFLSSISKAVIILFQLNHIHNGILLLITLRECLWLYPVSFLLFVPKVYRVYRGLIQPEKQAALSRQISVINTHALLSRQDSYGLSSINTQRNRRLNSAQSLLSVSSTSSCSSCETDFSDISKRTTHKKVTFYLNPSLTIQEHSGNEDDPVFITNPVAANESETEL